MRRSRSCTWNDGQRGSEHNAGWVTGTLKNVNETSWLAFAVYSICDAMIGDSQT